MSDLAVLVPSRGRPENIARLMAAMEETCEGDTDLIVGLDADDSALDAYMALDWHERAYYAVQYDGLRQVVALLNFLAVPNTKRYGAMGNIGDDQMPRTKGWDTMILEALEEVPFAFGDDLYPGRPAGSLCCHCFMRSSIVDALGYIGPPELRHMYVDPVWMAWGESTGIRFLPDVILEHMHYSAGKSVHDQTYAESLAVNDADCEAFNVYFATGRFNDDVRKLGGRELTADERLDMQVRLNIPVIA